mgnify:FL=1
MTNTNPLNQMEEKIKQLIAELEERNEELTRVAGRFILHSKTKQRAIYCTERMSENKNVINRLNSILKGE